MHPLLLDLYVRNTILHFLIGLTCDYSLTFLLPSLTILQAYWSAIGLEIFGSDQKNGYHVESTSSSSSSSIHAKQIQMFTFWVPNYIDCKFVDKFLKKHYENFNYIFFVF